MLRHIRISWGALKIPFPEPRIRYTDAIGLQWGLGLIIKKKKIPINSSVHLAIKSIAFQVFVGLFILRRSWATYD